MLVFKRLNHADRTIERVVTSMMDEQVCVESWCGQECIVTCSAAATAMLCQTSYMSVL